MNKINSTKVKELLGCAVEKTCSVFRDEAERVDPDHWNESVFRYQIIRNLIEIQPGLDCRTEWKKIDLMIPAEDGVVLVELKFYSKRPTRDHKGNLLGWKGGAGAKNYRESLAVIKKLSEDMDGHIGNLVNGIAGRVLVLAYLDYVGLRQKSFRSYHLGISSETHVGRVTKVVDQITIGESRVLDCLVIDVEEG